MAEPAEQIQDQEAPDVSGSPDVVPIETDSEEEPALVIVDVGDFEMDEPVAESAKEETAGSAEQMTTVSSDQTADHGRRNVHPPTTTRMPMPTTGIGLGAVSLVQCVTRESNPTAAGCGDRVPPADSRPPEASASVSGSVLNAPMQGLGLGSSRSVSSPNPGVSQSGVSGMREEVSTLVAAETLPSEVRRSCDREGVVVIPNDCWAGYRSFTITWPVTNGYRVHTVANSGEWDSWSAAGVLGLGRKKCRKVKTILQAKEVEFSQQRAQAAEAVAMT